MEERKDNKGLASLEDILTNAPNDSLDETPPEVKTEEIVDIDSPLEEKSIFDEILESDLETKDETNTIDLNINEDSDKELPSENLDSEMVNSNENYNPLDVSFETNNTNTVEESNEIETNIINEDSSVPSVSNEEVSQDNNISQPTSIFESNQDSIDSQVYTTTVDDTNIVNDNISPRSENNNSSSGSYFGFEKRVLVYSVLFVVLFVLSFFLVYKSFVVDSAEYINYTETSNLDYNVYLKENTFYDQPFLGKDMVYVASLIDHIDIDFLYNFNISEKTNLSLDYSVVGELSITDPDGKKVYLTRSYDLMPKKTIDMNNKNDHTFTEKIIIDYEQYNQIANSFKATYGVDTNSKLSVYLRVDKTSKDGKLTDSGEENNMLIEIPLSQRSVSISMDYNNINNNSNLVKDKSVSIGNIVLLLIALVVFLISIISLVKLLKLLGMLNSNVTKHDKYINKLMRQYDRLIVEHFTCPDLQKFNVIKIKDFNELLDMRDNLKTPILYYNVQKHIKSYFYIQNFKDLYLLVIKDIDLENKK